MKSVLLTITLSVCMSIGLVAQFPSDISGEELREWLRTEYYSSDFQDLGYNSARVEMYSYVDERLGEVECVYSGFQQASEFTTFLDPINTEHLVPQSFFGSAEPMRSDIHVIRPCHGDANSARAAMAFGNIEPSAILSWYGVDGFGAFQSLAIAPSLPENFSKQGLDLWEPIEDKKGDIARQLFYFFTMYPFQAGTISDVAVLEDLIQWHFDDPVDADEQVRNQRIEIAQGNRNPYIDFPSVMMPAWGQQSICGLPMNVQVTQVEFDRFHLAWSSQEPEASYKLQYGLEGYQLGNFESIYFASVLDTVQQLSEGLMSNTCYDIYLQTNCADGDSPWVGPFSVCTLPDYCSGDEFVDSGSLSGDYSSQEDTVYVLCPEASDAAVSIVFDFVDIAVNETGLGNAGGCWDYLSIYNGPDTLSPVLASSLCGELSLSGQSPFVPSSLLLEGDEFSSTHPSGCLTVRFRSDEIINQAGWSASVSCLPVCEAPFGLDVIELNFGSEQASIRPVWSNPEGTSTCQIRGGRISPASLLQQVPEFSNPNNLVVLSQTDGNSLLFNVPLYGNPNINFSIGQSYGYEVRCACADGNIASDWSGLSMSSVFTVPELSPGSFTFNSSSIDWRQAYPGHILGDEQVRLYDLSGRILYQGTSSSMPEAAAFTSPSMYIIQVEGHEGLWSTYLMGYAN